MNRIAFVLLFIVVQASAAFSQGLSLGDLARRERDRRKDLDISKDQLVRDVLQRSGAASLIEQFGKSFSETNDAQFGELPPEIRDRMRSSGAESFNPSKLMPIFENAFAIEIDNVSLNEVSRWYQTATGMRVLQAETTAASKLASNTIPTQPPAERLRLVQELDNATHVSDRMVVVMLEMLKAMLKQMLVASPDSDRTKSVFLTGFEQGFTKSAAPRMKASIMASYLNTYSSLSDDELQDYIRFLNTGAGKKFGGATWAGLQKAMGQAGADAGIKYAEILRQNVRSVHPRASPTQ